MTAPEPAMKPQDTMIYLLGELKGSMAAVQTSLTQQASSQAAINAENRREHDEFRKTLESNTKDLAEVKALQPQRVSPWSKAGVIVAVPASLVALVGFITIYLQPR